MGDAKRRAAIREAHEVKHSEPWLCPNCDKEVRFIVQNGWARCPNCTYCNQRTAFGFAVQDAFT